MKSFFQGIKAFLFQSIQFVIKNKLVLVLLFVVGVGLGYFLDKKLKSYNSEIIVTPNFGSTDYLSSKIFLLNEKIKENDTVFLKSIGIQDPVKITKISMEPIVDIYKFVENKTENFELLKLMSEDGDINKIIVGDLTSKNYTFHKISFKTNKLITDKGTIQPILNYLNDTDYFKKIQKEVLNNIKVKMVQNDTIISQINGFLDGFSNTVNGPQKSDKLVYYNENSQLNDVIKTKDALITEQGAHRIALVGLDKIIKDNSTIINIKNTKSTNGKMKLILPIIFILGFLGLVGFRQFYKKQMTLSKDKN
jgi:hypothetical protein